MTHVLYQRLRKLFGTNEPPEEDEAVTDFVDARRLCCATSLWTPDRTAAARKIMVVVVATMVGSQGIFPRLGN